MFDDLGDFVVTWVILGVILFVLIVIGIIGILVCCTSSFLTRGSLTMPHDANGVEIKVGDRVTIEFEVKEVHMTEEFCNVRLRSRLPMPPYQDQFVDLAAVNTRQTVKVVKAGDGVLQDDSMPERMR